MYRIKKNIKQTYSHIGSQDQQHSDQYNFKVINCYLNNYSTTVTHGKSTPKVVNLLKTPLLMGQS